MEGLEWLALVGSMVGLFAAVGMVATAGIGLTRSAGDDCARVGYGYLGSSGLLLGIGSGLLLVATEAPYVESSWSALVAVVTVNLLIQPLAVAFGWMGFRKLTLGLCGCVCYAWRRIPESELAELRPDQRNALAWYCVVQGLLALPFGIGLSAACAWPLLP